MLRFTNDGLRLIVVKKTYDEEPPRMRWSSRRDYLCASIGLIVGLGNAWRFPILLSRNGGSAFLIPYTLATVCLAIPITYVELALGQFSERGPTGIWILCPLAKGVGWAIVLYSVYICCYYNVILSYCAYYFFSSLTFDLPWKSCKGSWVKENCYTRKESSEILRSCVSKHGKGHCNNMTWELATEHFWRRRVLDIASMDLTSGLGGIKWDLALCLFLMCVIISLVSCMGLRSIEKVAPFTTVYPYISLFVLLFVTLIHEGSGIGVNFLLYPDFSKLADVDIWRLAVEQVFYSVGVASGSLIAFGSYCPFRNPVHMDAVTLNLVDYGTSLIFGVVLYNCLGAISYDLNIDIQDVAANKTLTFVLIPEALLHLPGPSMIWSLVFYSMVICVGLSTEYCLVASNLGVIYDLYPITLKYKLYMSAGAGLVIFILGLPLVTRNGSVLLNMIDNYCGGPIVMTEVFLEALVLFWIYGVKKITDDIHFMLGFRPTTYWQACWLLGPAYLGTTVVLGIYYEAKNPTFCVYLQVIGWILFTIPIIIIACFGIYNTIKYRRMNRTLHMLKPESTWGPKNPVLMKSRRMFSSQAMTKEYMYRQARLQARDRIRRQSTAVSYIAAHGSMPMLESILHLPGLDINKQDNEGNTPLHFAAQAGHVEVMNYILSRCTGVEVDARNNLGFTPLMKAALQGRTKCAKLLLFAGASPTLRDTGRGLRAEQWARFCGRYVCAEMIEKFARHRLLERTTAYGRWGSEPELGARLLMGGKLPQNNQNTSQLSGFKSKLRRAFRTNSSGATTDSNRQNYSLVTQLTTAALCVSTPVLPTPNVPPVVKSLIRPLTVPKLHVTLASGAESGASSTREPENVAPEHASTTNSSVVRDRPPTARPSVVRHKKKK